MTHEADAGTERGLTKTQMLKIVVGVVILAAIVLFGVVNTHEVVVDWVFDESEMALWIVIAVTAVAGFVAGYISSYRRR